MHILETAPTDTWLASIRLFGIPVLSFIAAGVGAYVGSYLKKRGENLATKDDFDDLKEQTRQLTQATKEIEARISDQLWNRQRRWELKRDTLLEATKRLTEVNDAIYGWVAVMSYPQSRSKRDLDDELSAPVNRWIKAYDEYGTSVALAGIVCDEDTIAPLEKLAEFLGDVNENIHNQELIRVRTRLKELDTLVVTVKAAIRREIHK